MVKIITELLGIYSARKICSHKNRHANFELELIGTLLFINKHFGMLEVQHFYKFKV